MATVTEEKPKTKVNKLVTGTATLNLNLNINGSERLNLRDRKEMYKDIGSSFKKMPNGAITEDVNIPFTRHELEIFMPMVIGADVQDRTNFNMEVQKYWKNYEVRVKGDSPLILDISHTPTEFKVKNSKGEDETIVVDMPENIKHWFMYKFCLQHALVAKTKEERGDNNMWVFLEDEKEAAKEQEDTLAIKMLADKEYLLLAEDNANIDKLEAFISVTKEQTTKTLKTLVDKKSFIYNLKDKDPKNFLSIVQDKDLTIKAKIYDMVEYGVLKYTNNIYSYGDNVLGTKDEAVLYLKNPNNKDIVLMEELLLNAKRK